MITVFVTFKSGKSGMYYLRTFQAEYISEFHEFSITGENYYQDKVGIAISCLNHVVSFDVK